MLERVSVNLKGPLEYDSEAEERPASPPPDSETLYALIFNVSFIFFINENFDTNFPFQDVNLSVDKDTFNENSRKSFSILCIEFFDRESSKDDKQ